jgi:hypothetical protein
VDIFVILWQLVLNVFDLIVAVLQLGLRWWLLLAWFCWWTFAVDWRRAWAYLGQGGWAPLALIMLIGGFVWSRIEPGPCSCLGFMTVPNFWWQLGAVGLLVALTFLCGWIQRLIGWMPPEIDLEPPAHVEQAHHH